jgi:hypothetical protein
MRKYTNEYFREAICCKMQDLNLIAQKADHYLPYLLYYFQIYLATLAIHNIA